MLALGSKSNREFASQLEKLGIERHIVGDCRQVGKLAEAVEEGFRAGFAL